LNATRVSQFQRINRPVHIFNGRAQIFTFLTYRPKWSQPVENDKISRNDHDKTKMHWRDAEVLHQLESLNKKKARSAFEYYLTTISKPYCTAICEEVSIHLSENQKTSELRQMFDEMEQRGEQPSEAFHNRVLYTLYFDEDPSFIEEFLKKMEDRGFVPVPRAVNQVLLSWRDTLPEKAVEFYKKMRVLGKIDWHTIGIMSTLNDTHQRAIFESLQVINTKDVFLLVASGDRDISIAKYRDEDLWFLRIMQDLEAEGVDRAMRRYEEMRSKRIESTGILQLLMAKIYMMNGENTKANTLLLSYSTAQDIVPEKLKDSQQVDRIESLIEDLLVMIPTEESGLVDKVYQLALTFRGSSAV